MEVNNIINEYCGGCEDYNTYNCTSDCIFNRLRTAVKNMDTSNVVPTFEGNCNICKAKKGRKREIFFDDGRGGLAIADFCPSCGKRI